MSLGPALFSIYAALMGLLPSARGLENPPAPTVECSELLHSKYHGFASFADQGYRTLLTLSPHEREALYALSRMVTAKDPSDIADIRKALDRYAGLSKKSRTQLRDILGLNEPTTREALEVFRKKFEYLFWSDHSERHVAEIIEVAHRWAREAPPVLRLKFQPILDSDTWQRRIDQALLLHDSRMSVTRELHAQAVLGFTAEELPSAWSPREQILSAVLAFLHSKSNVPYAVLPNWQKILVEVKLPELLRNGLIDQARADQITSIVHGLTATEVNQMASAAGWIRMIDANRPIGENLRNSIGQTFVLAVGGRSVVLQTPSGQVPLVPSQMEIEYGQVAIDNPTITQAPDGTLSANFHLRVPEPYRSKLKQELGPVPFAQLKVPDGLSWQATAVTRTIESILGDFPPEILGELRITIQ